MTKKRGGCSLFVDYLQQNFKKATINPKFGTLKNCFQSIK